VINAINNGVIVAALLGVLVFVACEVSERVRHFVSKAYIHYTNWIFSLMEKFDDALVEDL
jgi:hypothetical protein